MFFYLSKTLDALLSPLTWALLLFVAGIYFSLSHGGKRRRASLLCWAGGFLVIAIFSSGWMADVLWRQLEAPAEKTYRPEIQYDAVIVLSGLVEADATEAHGEPSYNDNVERLLRAYDLLRANKVKSVLLSGGSGRWDRSGPVEADVLAKQLEDWGIDRSRIVEERVSRNTRENATESAKVIAAQHWSSLLLVTSAFHMPRAAASFSAAGLKVDLLPVDFRTGHGAPDSWFPRAGALSASTGALRELFGRVVYKVVHYAN